MKRSSLKVLSILSLGLFFVGCEPHSFEETKGLHQDHGKHEAHDAHAADPHATEHGEKPHGEAAKAEAKEAHPAPAAPAAEPRKTGL